MLDSVHEFTCFRRLSDSWTICSGTSRLPLAGPQPSQHLGAPSFHLLHWESWEESASTRLLSVRWSFCTQDVSIASSKGNVLEKAPEKLLPLLPQRWYQGSKEGHASCTKSSHRRWKKTCAVQLARKNSLKTRILFSFFFFSFLKKEVLRLWKGDTPSLLWKAVQLTAELFVFLSTHITFPQSP